MSNCNYFWAISARFFSQKGKRYFTGYLIDRGTEQHRYDVIVKEKQELETESKLKRTTLSTYKVIRFARKEHLRKFAEQSVERFNQHEELKKYYNWKKMLLGLFVAEVEKRGIDVGTIDLKNVNYIIGEAY
jgi:hypothetical protein